MFNLSPLGRGELALFRVARSTRINQDMALRSRIEGQPSDLRRHHDMRDGALTQFCQRWRLRDIFDGNDDEELVFDQFRGSHGV